MIESNIRQAVQTLSELPQNKVALMTIPETTAPPHITIKKVSYVPEYTHDGMDELTTSRYSLYIYHTSYAELKKLCDKVRFIGTYEDFDIAWIQLVNQIDGYDSDTRVYNTIMDILVRHYE